MNNEIESISVQKIKQLYNCSSQCDYIIEVYKNISHKGTDGNYRSNNHNDSITNHEQCKQLCAVRLLTLTTVYVHCTVGVCRLFQTVSLKSRFIFISSYKDDVPISDYNKSGHRLIYNQKFEIS